MKNFSTRAMGVSLAILACAAGTSVFAQAYPNRPVKIIVPFATGSTSDILGRTIGDRLTQALGQPYVVDNRPGAGGTIGSEFVAKSPADGYTLLLSTAATPISASAYPSLKYDTGQFASVIVLTHSPLGFAANLNFPPRTVREFIDYAKANPAKVNFGSLGNGTSHHLTGEKLKLDAGISMQHVPYKGSAAAHTDLMGGQIQVMFDNLVALLPHFKGGKLRPLAVSSIKRHPLLPEVPSLSEAGVRDFEAVAWFGILAPPATPKDIIARLNTEVAKILMIPEIRQRLIDGGSEVIANSPEAADKFLQSEIARWGTVVKAANIRLE